MGPAWHKARREMPPGSWLVSLDFPVEGVSPQLSLQQPGERAVFAYRLGGHPARRAAFVAGARAVLPSLPAMAVWGMSFGCSPSAVT
jgi:hypothetical protein